ncbi:Fe-S cluster assembly ATPase SufC [Marispirochaeta aestuarii]|uniref:Fe-S cluster assembly ATPase SufC n=1 Tax=Marispirochaeta aestuarii TaxID=1963862 RepID=UPI0029C7DDC3|nr:Fe-S cluster assembly ATPase SufC [Marispirochaeta aestuarii]
MIRINNLTVEIEEKTILKNLDLHIPEGELHVLMGPNGSGKTSLLMTLAGYPQYKITSGTISMQGHDLLQLDMTQRARLGIGMAEQRPPSISGVTLEMLLDYQLNRHPGKRDEIVGLTRNIGMESFLKRSINEGLSGGEIKRSEILLLMSMQPLFAMLDEPDSGVDIESLETVASMLTTLFSPEDEFPAKRRTGLMITHSDRLLEKIHADKVHIMLDGRIICSGNPEIIMNKIADSGFESCRRCTGK